MKIIIFSTKYSKIFKFSQYHSLKTKISAHNNDFRCRKLIDLIKNRHFWLKNYESYCFPNRNKSHFCPKHTFFRNFLTFKIPKFWNFTLNDDFVGGNAIFNNAIFSRIFSKIHNFDTKYAFLIFNNRVIQNFDCKRSSIWSIDDV